MSGSNTGCPFLSIPSLKPFLGEMETLDEVPESLWQVPGSYFGETSYTSRLVAYPVDLSLGLTLLDHRDHAMKRRSTSEHRVSYSGPGKSARYTG